jgi:hypothetical protein
LSVITGEVECAAVTSAESIAADPVNPQPIYFSDQGIAGRLSASSS